MRFIRIFLMGLFAIAGISTIGYFYVTGPKADEPTWEDNSISLPIPIGVYSKEFTAATTAAMNVWNSAAGFKLFIPGSDVIVLSGNGEPCGSPWRPKTEQGHQATAYRCKDRWEIMIEIPGNFHKQMCLITHELGHVLGFKHDPTGVMSNKCPRRVTVSDKDTEALRKRYNLNGR